jgi:hypothetical protein
MFMEAQDNQNAYIAIALFSYIFIAYEKHEKNLKSQV